MYTVVFVVTAVKAEVLVVERVVGVLSVFVVDVQAVVGVELVMVVLVDVERAVVVLVNVDSLPPRVLIFVVLVAVSGSM